MFQPRAPLSGRSSFPLLFGGFCTALILAACGGGSDKRRIASEDADTLGLYAVSGQIGIRGTANVDSDTNDPGQGNRAPNNTLETAQVINDTPVSLFGFVNTPGTGVPDGALFGSGDPVDAFSIRLRAGQVIELHSREVDVDVDLFVYDENQELVGASNNMGGFDCLRVMRTASHFVSVSVAVDQTGAAGYRLVVLPDGSGSTCTAQTNLQEVLVPGELIVQTDTSNHAITKSSPVVIKGALVAGQRALIQAPGFYSGNAQTKSTETVDPYRVQGTRKSIRTRDIEQTVLTAKRLRMSGRYAHVRLNTMVRLSQVTPPQLIARLPSNDPDYGAQSWHYAAIDLPGAMRILTDMTSLPQRHPVVAVIDSGIIANHPDLVSVTVPGADMIRNAAVSGDGDGIDADPSDESTPETSPAFHGTHVAGTVAAQTNNGLNGTGVAPMARVMPIRVVNTNGLAALFDILEAVAWAAGLPNSSGLPSPAQPADIINLSLGGSDACMSIEADLVRRVREAGIIVVGASGNDSTQQVLMPVASPANCQGVIAVGATNYFNEHAVYSNGGANLDLVAPGGDYSLGTLSTGIASTGGAFVSGQVQPVSSFKVGTSMATPHVAGVLALMKFVAPSISPDDIDNLIATGKLTNDLGPSGWDEQYGGGLINARKAVREAIAYAAGSVPEPSIIISPRSLNLSEFSVSASLQLTASTVLDDPIVDVQSTTSRVTVVANAIDSNTGLGNYSVTLNTEISDSGQTDFEFITISFQSGATIQVPLAIRALGTVAGNLGALHVQVIDANRSTTSDPVIVGQIIVPAATDGIYDYSIPNIPGIERISIHARIAPDYLLKRDCTLENWCHQFEQGGSTVLKPTGNLNGISFDLAFPGAPIPNNE